jgi:hypothetical protein
LEEFNLPNEEDYLDSLLNSIQDVRHKNSAEARRSDSKRLERQRQRRAIDPDEDFLEASGLDDFKPRNSDHKNLRKALSEESYLSEFEKDLNNDNDYDDFLKRFEDDLDLSSERNKSEKKRKIIKDESSMNGREESSEQESPDKGVSEHTLSEESPDKGVSEHTLSEDSSHHKDSSISKEDHDISKKETVTEIDSRKEDHDDSSLSLDDLSEPDPSSMNEEASDSGIDSLLDSAMDLMSEEAAPLPEDNGIKIDEETGEPDLSGNSDSDLNDLLEGSGDDSLGDISNLLDKDSSGEAIPEAFESFSQAEKEAEKPIDQAEEVKDEKKEGLFSKLFSKFGKKKEKKDDTLVLSQEKKTDLGAEDEKILREMSNEGEPEIDPDDDGTQLLAQFFGKLKSKQAEKKAAKEEEKKNAPPKEKPKKEKKKKEPKPKKEKKPKPVDNSPLIPVKGIAVNILLGISLIAVIYIGTTLIGQRNLKTEAEAAFSNKDYEKAYKLLDGQTEIKDKKLEKIYKESMLMADLSSRWDRYQVFLNMKKYDYALNELILGYGASVKNMDLAKSYGLDGDYSAMQANFTQALSDKFGVSPDSAEEMYNISNRKRFTIAFNEVLTKAGLENGK